VNPWKDFVTSGAIDKLYSYSVNTSSVETDIAHIADNAEDMVSEPAINLTNISQLQAALIATVDLYRDGSFTNDANGNTLITFGADGGHLASVTVGSTTALYDALNPSQTISGQHGDFIIDFDTGTYRYIVTDTTYASHTEQIGAVIEDNDADKVNTLLLNVNIVYDASFSTSPIITDGDNSILLNTGHVIGTVSDSDGIDSAPANTYATATHGTVVIDGSGNIIYTPTTGYIGTDVIFVKATDTLANESTRNIPITVYATVGEIADAPSLVMNIGADTNVSWSVLDDFATNLDGWSGNASTITWDSGNNRLSLENNDNISLTQTATKTFSGLGLANEQITISLDTAVASGWDNGTDSMNIYNDGVLIYQNSDKALLGGTTHTFQTTLDANGDLVLAIENTGDSGSVGAESLFVDNITIGNTLSYKHALDLTATLNDLTETLSDVTLSHIPVFAHLEDALGNPFTVNADGTYTVAVTSAVTSTVYLVSSVALTTTEINAVRASVTSTVASSGDIATIEVDVNASAQIIDGIIEGLHFTTSSGFEGLTNADGYFDYVDGDVVTFTLGNIELGQIDTANIVDGKVFLQDIASVDRTNMNDNYVENMAVLLQSLDSDSGDNIVITEATHRAFSDESFDLESMSEEELKAVLKENSVEAVSEADAMEHVQDMLGVYTGMSAFDIRIEDDGIDMRILLEEGAENIERTPLGELSLGLEDVLLLANIASDELSQDISTENKENDDFDIYNNRNDVTVEVKVEENILDSLI
jgi:hypothetical protein